MIQKNLIENDTKKIDYMVIKQLELHAKQYDSVANKKEFLKNVCAYEQKIILLNSKEPYEVLNYMQELDLKSSRLVLDELNYEEIKSLLELFTSEHKKRFYNFFSCLELVNNFIAYDKNSYEYVKDLPFDRKLSLLKKTDEKTIQASTELYESMTKVEKDEAIESISFDSSAETSFVLKEVQQDLENNQTEDFMKKDDSEVNNEEETIEKETDQTQNENNEKLEENNELQKTEEVKNNEQSELKEEVTKDVLEHTEYLEKYSIIGNGESSVSIVSNPKSVQDFNEAKQQNEKNEIENIKKAFEETLVVNEQKQI